MRADNGKFKQHQGICASLAWRFAKKSGIPFRDMLSLARLRLLIEIAKWNEKYDPNKSAESTWVYINIYWELKAFCAKEKQRKMLPISCLESSQLWDIPERDRIKEILDSLSDDGELAVQIVLHAPKEIEEIIFNGTKPQKRKSLKNYLKNCYNWNEKQVNRVWKEIRLCL